MQLRKEFRLTFGLIFGLQAATAFATIALLSRMGPAISHLVADNVESLTAVERMLEALATSSGPLAEESAAQFRQAYARARANVTEEGEQPLLEEIEREAEAAFRGDPEARTAVVLNLQRLSDVNRQAMLRASDEAKRLASAGAWVSAMLALLAFLAARLLAERAEHRLIVPLRDIYLTLQAAKKGDTRRRTALHKGSAEIEGIASGVNALLDTK